MGESRAADYIAIGASRGAENFLAGLEKRRDEEKREAKEFKSLADFAEASGLLSKDQAMVMDKDSLKGFVQGKMWAAENTRQNQEANIRSYATMQKLAEFMQQQGRQDSIEGFQQDYSNNVAMGYAPNLGEFYENPGSFNYKQPPADLTASFTNAMARNPGVDPNDLNAFMSSYDKALPPAAKQWAPTELEKELAAKKRAENEGRTSDAAQHARRAAKLQAFSKGIRMVGPDGTVLEVGGEDDGVTQGTQSKLEMSVQNTRKGLDMMGELADTISWKDVGPAGVFGENVMDKLLPAFGVKTMNKGRVDKRTQLRTLIQTMARQVNPDNRFSEQDMKRVEKIMPSTGILENEDHAKQVLATLTRVFAKRNISDMQAMGKEIDAESLTNEEIGAAVEMGLMDLETAKEILRARPD